MENRSSPKLMPPVRRGQIFCRGGSASEPFRSRPAVVAAGTTRPSRGQGAQGGSRVQPTSPTVKEYAKKRDSTPSAGIEGLADDGKQCIFGRRHFLLPSTGSERKVRRAVNHVADPSRTGTRTTWGKLN